MIVSGNMRWRKPVNPSSWHGVRNGTVPGPMCPQTSYTKELGWRGPPQGDEDCLYLNVYTPKVKIV